MSDNKFRSSIGSRYLKGLFFETTLADKSTVLYTLKDKDHRVESKDEGTVVTFPSLYRLYMELDDLTEYEFANTYLDGWEHWIMLCECTWFKEYIARWRTELELRTKAKALRALKEEASGSGRNAYSANKILLEGGWKEKATGSSKGRPKKAVDEEKEAVLKYEQKKKIEADFKRMGIE